MSSTPRSTRRGERPDRCRSSSATPYGIEGRANAFNEYFKELADEGYIFVLPGHSRAVQVGREVRHDAAGPPSPKDPKRSTKAPTRRHHRLAAQERAEQQRPRRHARRQLPRLADRRWRSRPAPGAQGRLAAGVAGRHVPRRRLPSQRRVPPQLRLRVRRHDGDRQDVNNFQVRSHDTFEWYLKLGAAVERQPEVSSRARCRPGTTSSRIRTTTSSGRSKRSSRT